jgi:hypothetical protein
VLFLSGLLFLLLLLLLLSLHILFGRFFAFFVRKGLRLSPFGIRIFCFHELEHLVVGRGLASSGLPSSGNTLCYGEMACSAQEDSSRSHSRAHCSS